jgi:hypothetical protein
MQRQRTHACAPATTRGRATLLGLHGSDTLAFANGRAVVLLNVRTLEVDTFHEVRPAAGEGDRAD